MLGTGVTRALRRCGSKSFEETVVRKLALIAAAVVGFLASQAWAFPVLAPDQYKFKFTNAEVFLDAAGNQVSGPTIGGYAVGIIDLTQILSATTNTVIWNKGDNGEFLSGIFRTPQILTITPTATGFTVDAATGGFIDIFLDPSQVNFTLGTGGYASGGCTEAAGTCYDSITNVGGSLFLSLAWGAGIVPTNGLIGLDATFSSNTLPLTGHGQGFLDVTGGSQASIWDTNGFATNFGNRDFFLQNDFCTNGQIACVIGGNWQLRSEDPTLGNVVAQAPEPATLALLGLGLAGLGYFGKRRRG
jgi:hypothetical protein